jgi:Protein of unknown function (DUF3892)
MVYVTAVHMEGGAQHEHIAAVRWQDPQTTQSNTATREQMVTYIRSNPGVVKVTDGRNTVDVGVVEVNPPHLRTHADGKWTDNLLALPRY